MSLKPEKILVCTQNPNLMSLSKAEISFVSFADIVKGRDANVRTYNNEFCAVDISSVMSGKGINYAGEVCFFLTILSRKLRDKMFATILSC